MRRLKSIELKPVYLWMAFLAGIVAIGAIGAIIVFTKGLVVTNLTDLVPWGLWITIDLSSIALGAGAFLLCAAVYLLGLKQFQALARTATFIGLLGYSMAMLTLVMDIGRPDRFWHAFLYWNPHSVLWEITMCVGLYFTVLLLETAPIVGRTSWMRERWPKLSARLESVHHYAPFLAVIGLCLSLLHQSSLGATYGVLKARPIWYRPGISVLFIVSAMAGGPALTVFATKLVGRLSGRIRINHDLLDQVSSFIGWVLIGYLYFRFWDAFSMTYTYLPGRNEGLDLLTRGPLALNFWVGEILLGAAIPIIILRVERLRRNWFLHMAALLMIVGGVVAYRWDTNMAGELIVMTYLPQEIEAIYTSYMPSLIEWITGLGVVAFGMLAFTIGVRYLNVVDHRETVDEQQMEFDLVTSAAD
jgi:Ni/Fe-hydrogenase subunit HybB-like protein